MWKEIKEILVISFEIFVVLMLCVGLASTLICRCYAGL